MTARQVARQLLLAHRLASPGPYRLNAGGTAVINGVWGNARTGGAVDRAIANCPDRADADYVLAAYTAAPDVYQALLALQDAVLRHLEGEIDAAALRAVLEAQQ